MRIILLALALLSAASVADEPKADSVAFRMKVGDENRRVRMPLSDTTTWKNPAWKGGVMFAIKRIGSGVIVLDASLKVEGKLTPVKSQELSTGQTFVLVPGVDVQNDFFGPGVRFELIFES